jgi:hypothetical protein
MTLKSVIRARERREHENIRTWVQTDCALLIKNVSLNLLIHSELSEALSIHLFQSSSCRILWHGIHIYLLTYPSSALSCLVGIKTSKGGPQQKKVKLKCFNVINGHEILFFASLYFWDGRERERGWKGIIINVMNSHTSKIVNFFYSPLYWLKDMWRRPRHRHSMTVHE